MKEIQHTPETMKYRSLFKEKNSAITLTKKTKQTQAKNYIDSSTGPPKRLLICFFHSLLGSEIAKGTGDSHLPSNQSIAALAEGGSSKDTVASPFGLPVSLSVYRFIMGLPVFLLV